MKGAPRAVLSENLWKVTHRKWMDRVVVPGTVPRFEGESDAPYSYMEEVHSGRATTRKDKVASWAQQAIHHAKWVNTVAAARRHSSRPRGRGKEGARRET